MKLIPLKATSEFVDVKKAGLVTYQTDQTVNQPAVILMHNPEGTFGMVLVDQVHLDGPVVVRMRPSGPAPVKKYQINDVIGYIAIFE